MARLVVKGWTIDLARREGTSLEADLQRRDYRINAIALELTSTPRLVDPTGGLNDLKAGLLTAVAEQNLIDDPLRLLRGLRLAAELGFAIAGTTQPFLALHSHRLPQAAPERIQAELNKLVRAAWADQALTQLQTSGLIQPWAAPRTANSKALAAQSIEQQTTLLNDEEREKALPLLRLTALLSDEGLQQLRFSRRQIQRCRRLRAWQKRNDGQAYAELPDEDRLQLHTELGSDLPALLVQLQPEEQQTWLDRWRNQQDRLFHPRPPIDGNTLQKTLGIAAGPELGRLIKHLAVESAFGRIKGQNAALAAAKSWWQKHSNSSLDA
jgi:tRNA nucleotidyltransferase (CCA-adding enzyme)